MLCDVLNGIMEGKIKGFEGGGGWIVSKVWIWASSAEPMSFS